MKTPIPRRGVNNIRIRLISPQHKFIECQNWLSRTRRIQHLVNRLNIELILPDFDHAPQQKPESKSGKIKHYKAIKHFEESIPLLPSINPFDSVFQDVQLSIATPSLPSIEVRLLVSKLLLILISTPGLNSLRPRDSFP